MKMNTLDGIKQVHFIFRDVTISYYEEFLEIQHDIHCKIFEHKLFEPMSEWTKDDQEALYVHFIQRYSKIRNKPKELRDAMLLDLYLQASYVRFGYAMTCHKAQGDEWENV